jgi:hypothetical protein
MCTGTMCKAPGMDVHVKPENLKFVKGGALQSFKCTIFEWREKQRDTSACHDEAPGFRPAPRGDVDVQHYAITWHRRHLLLISPIR